MSKCEELKVLGRFYGKIVYGNANPIADLCYLNSAKDWKFIQFKGKIEVEALSPHECMIKLPSGIQRNRWTCLGWVKKYKRIREITHGGKMKRTDKILKTIALGTSREILRQLAEKPSTVRELRGRSKGLRNRVSFYKSLNRMVGLGIVVRYRDPGIRGLVYGLSKSEVVVDLKGGKVRVI